MMIRHAGIVICINQMFSQYLMISGCSLLSAQAIVPGEVNNARVENDDDVIQIVVDERTREVRSEQASNLKSQKRLTQPSYV